ncbi:DUF3558 domain-containing protein [Streptomyces sp. TRM49041]|uniref:DUF3558 domain-containing protein n=1 Tax=Streptomyces sp. TRM49041 TaxID=2603216 RepID=UPI0011EBEC3E|nr:DUF3558 domain-containing protein [Streptomyces sp. TRM49041]
MQRRAYASGLSALLAALTATTLAGCTSGSGTGGSGADAKSGTAAGSVAAPGRYRTLYEPCGSVARATLQEMLPGVTRLSPEQRDRVLRGTAAVTYDTDRRAGCSWKADGLDAIHHLTLDFERVVSYDPTVSDETRAQEVYAGKEAGAGLTPATPTATASTGTGTTAPGTPGTPAAPGTTTPAAGQEAQTVSPAPATPGAPASAPVPPPSAPPSSAPPAPSAPPQGLEPRLLTDLGDAAFLDDVLAPAGSAAQQRTVSVVFRTSNVIVTVRYGAQPMRVGEVPDSEELQERARQLARRLADRFDE